jgi:septum formation protein
MSASETVMKPRLVLASASPRRRELLGRIVRAFEVVVADVDEDALTVADPWQTAERLAEAKAVVVAAGHPKALVIGSDTVVAFQGVGGWTQLAKPADPEDAVRMLLTLSGQTHVVITGVSLVQGAEVDTFSVTSRVTFRSLEPEEVRAYVATGEPMDKAGAYAIQGGAAKFVERLEGSLENVIGLPLEELQKRLAGRDESALDPP